MENWVYSGVVHGIQKPILYGESNAIKASRRDLPDLLPIEGEVKRMRLISWELGAYSDPVCLYDSWGAIIYQWPDNYKPTLQDVQNIIANCLR